MNENNGKKVCLRNSHPPTYALKSEIEKRSRIILSGENSKPQTTFQPNTKSQNNTNGIKQSKQ